MESFLYTLNSNAANEAIVIVLMIQICPWILEKSGREPVGLVVIRSTNV